MTGLLLLLLAAVVLRPEGVTITLSGAGSSLAMRVGYGLLGLVAACLPPAAVTYAWYVRRVREWGNADRAMESPRRLAEGKAADMTARQRERMPISRDERTP